MAVSVDKWLSEGEMGEAEMVRRKIGGSLLYDYKAESWYRWNGKRWEGTSTGAVLSAIDEVISDIRKAVLALPRTSSMAEEANKTLKKMTTFVRRDHIIKLVKMKCEGEGDIPWDEHRMALPTCSGTVDLRTGELTAPSPADFYRKVAPITYAPGAKCPCWSDFLLSSMNGDSYIYNFIQRLIGYVISGTCREHIFPVLWGRGRNGKSVFIETIGSILGPLAGPVSSSLLMEKTYSRSSSAPSPDLMSLRGKKMAWANETEENKRLSTSIVKWLCGGDMIVGRGLYEKETSFVPTHTIFLLTNHRPVVSPDDYALWERVVLIPFELSFVDNPHEPYERKRNPYLSQWLAREKSGILNWMIEGCLLWQEHGIGIPRSLTAASSDYKFSVNDVQQFVRDRTEPLPGYAVPAQVMYDAYRKWCEAQGTKCRTQTDFGRLLAKQTKKERRASGIYYLDIGFQFDFAKNIENAQFEGLED